MYWNEYFNLDHLCTQYSIDGNSNEFIKNDILNIFKKFLTNSNKPEDLLSKIRQSDGPVAVCRVIWPNETVLFKCINCQYDETCAICVNCFLNSSHVGHSWSMSKSYGGCCDCGDSSSWKLSGCCYKHRGITKIQDGRKSISSFTCKFYNKAKYLIRQIVTFIDKHLFQYSTTPYKFLLIFVEILKDFANYLHGLRWIINRCITVKILYRWIDGYKDLDSKLQKAFGVFYLAMFASPKFKAKFSKPFVASYLKVIRPYRKFIFDSTAFSLTELSVQLFTVPDIAMYVLKSGFIDTSLEHLKKLFRSLLSSTSPHAQFITNGFLHESIQICSDLSFLLTHKQVSYEVIKDPKLHNQLFSTIACYNYSNPQVLHVDKHIEIQNTLYPLTFTIEDRLISAVKPLWLNLNSMISDIHLPILSHFYTNYFKSLVADIINASTLQKSDNNENEIFLCRTFHIPLMRFLPNFIDFKMLMEIISLQNIELIEQALMHVLTQCLSCQLFQLEIGRGFWIKNGDSMANQADKYRSMGFLSRDICAIQCVGICVNLLLKSKRFDFLKVLVENCFPFLNNQGGIAKFNDVLIQAPDFVNAFEAHYYKYVDSSLKWIWIILCRHVSNVSQLISSNWDFNGPVYVDDEDVKYFIYKMDLIHFLYQNPKNVSEVIRFIERKWPNGDLVGTLEEIATIRRYGNGNCDVVLKSKYLSLIDIYWPGDFNIFEEKVYADPKMDIRAIYPDKYLELHSSVVESISKSIVDLLKMTFGLDNKFVMPKYQLQTIMITLTRFGFLDADDFYVLSFPPDDKELLMSRVSPKRSVQTEALSSFRKKQSSFLATLEAMGLEESNDSDNEEDESDNQTCLLCHSPGDLKILCYQLPSTKKTPIPHFLHQYPPIRYIETCGHTVHEKCLSSYVSSRSNNNKSYPCPLCKLEVNFTLPYLDKLDKVTQPVHLVNAFAITYWELLTTISFKKNSLISERVTMLSQLIRHQYNGSIKSVCNGLSAHPDCVWWMLNPLSCYLHFLFNAKPSETEIKSFIRKLSYTVFIQLVADLTIDSPNIYEDNNSEKSFGTAYPGYFKVMAYYKHCLRMTGNKVHRKGVDYNNKGAIVLEVSTHRLKLKKVNIKLTNTKSSIATAGYVDTEDFVASLNKVLHYLSKGDSTIPFICDALQISDDQDLLGRLCDFLSLTIWCLHFIFPLKSQYIKKFAHEHLISDQAERFNLVWSLLGNGNRYKQDFIKVINDVLMECNIKSDVIRPQFSLRMFKLASDSDAIPQDYKQLLINMMDAKCIVCMRKPHSPTLCLFCCKWICLHCDIRQTYSGVFNHAIKCSFGTGCYFLVQQRKVLYICCYTKRFAYVDSIYSGPFGTFKENFTSNSPLELSESRLVAIANDIFFNRRSIRWQSDNVRSAPFG